MYAFHVQMPSAFGKVSVLTAAGFGRVFSMKRLGNPYVVFVWKELGNTFFQKTFFDV